LVLTVNVPVVWPEKMVIEFGTVADALLLDSFTNTPFDGVVWLLVFGPVHVRSPVTLVGLSVSEAMLASPGPEGLIVRAALALLRSEERRVGEERGARLLVLTVNVSVVWPEKMVIEFGTVGEQLWLDSVNRPQFR